MGPGVFSTGEPTAEVSAVVTFACLPRKHLLVEHPVNLGIAVRAAILNHHEAAVGVGRARRRVEKDDCPRCDAGEDGA